MQKRIIPVLTIDNDSMVKVIRFKEKLYLGDPLNIVKMFNDLEVDELVLIDIGATKNNRINFKLLRNIASQAFIPLTYGGGIKSKEDVKKLMNIGYERFVINSKFYDSDISFINELINEFGSQSIVLSIDIKKDSLNEFKIYNYLEDNYHEISLDTLIQKLNQYPVGELFFNFVDNDGVMEGMDLTKVSMISKKINNRALFMGGIGSFSDIKSFLSTVNDSLGVGSYFVFSSKKTRGVLINYLNTEQLNELNNNND